MTPTEVFIQQTINGLTIGSYLALIALGYTMVYGIIQLINFAHGDVFMMGFMISLTLLLAMGKTTTLKGFELVWVLVLVTAVTMLATGLMNLGIDRIAYKRLRHAPRLAALITAVGMSFLLENLAANWKGPSQIRYPPIFPSINILRDVFGMDTMLLLTTKDIFMLGVTIPLMILLVLLVQRTKLGRAMRAVAQDREAAATMGVDIERVIMLTFFIGGAMAGAAGTVVGLYLNTGRYLMGFEAGLKAFTAAVLGGIGNITGALLGGFFIGFLSAYSDQYLSSEWTRVVVFSMLILVLTLRPSGLLGEAPPEKY